MTCIVGIETRDGVVMGADSASVGGWTVNTTSLNKIVRCGKFMIGYTSSFRMGQLLQYTLNVPDQTNGDDLRYLSTVFVDGVRDCLAIGGYKEVSNEVEKGGTFLLAYKDKLYSIGDDFQVNRTTYGYDACGAGQDTAMAVLHALYSLDTELSVVTKLRLALEASAKVYPGLVAAPFRFEKLEVE